jgi:hypothetical protein
MNAHIHKRTGKTKLGYKKTKNKTKTKLNWILTEHRTKIFRCSNKIVMLNQDLITTKLDYLTYRFLSMSDIPCRPLLSNFCMNGINLSHTGETVFVLSPPYHVKEYNFMVWSCQNDFLSRFQLNFGGPASSILSLTSPLYPTRNSGQWTTRMETITFCYESNYL